MSAKEQRIENICYDMSWKTKDKKYLLELQKFLDSAANIEDEELRMRIINQMLRCDAILTKISNERFQNRKNRSIKF